MPNNKNVEIVEQLKDKLEKSKSVVFVDYQGLSASDVSALRSKISETGAEMAVAKNTLLEVALNEAKLDADKAQEALKGPTAAVFGYEDSVGPIKALFEFAKKLELPKIKSGFVDGLYTSFEQIEVLSKLPSREQLLGTVVSALNSPVAGFVNVLGGVPRKFVYAISAIAEKKEKEV
jgi:large subunit ribosomal protein L10